MQAPTNGNVVKDLLSLDDDDDITPAPSAQASFADDLLGLSAAPAAAPGGTVAQAASPLDLLSLLDDPAPVASTSGAASQPPPVRLLPDRLCHIAPLSPVKKPHCPAVPCEKTTDSTAKGPLGLDLLEYGSWLLQRRTSFPLSA